MIMYLKIVPFCLLRLLSDRDIMQALFSPVTENSWFCIIIFSRVKPEGPPKMSRLLMSQPFQDAAEGQSVDQLLVKYLRESHAGMPMRISKLPASLVLRLQRFGDGTCKRVNTSGELFP